MSTQPALFPAPAAPVVGKCRCGATLAAEATLWLTVRVWPAFAGRSPSAWSVCSFACLEKLARDQQAAAS
jgi:hypothetical protein